MPGHYSHKDWAWTWTIFPFSCFTLAMLCACLVLAFPPTRTIYRKLSICIIAIPLWYAFRYSDHVSSHYLINDTFARTCLIWVSHASYEICVLEFKPTLSRRRSSNTGQWAEVKERLRQALKVLNDRNHVQVAQQNGHFLPLTSDDLNGKVAYTATDKKSDEPIKVFMRVSHGIPIPQGHRHGKTRWEFVAYQIRKLLTLKALAYAYSLYESDYTFILHYQVATFSGRTGFIYRLYCNVEDVFDWCIVSITLYDAFHCVFAVFFVGIGLDEPEEWSLSLFGKITNAWSVRRYWSKHWHNFVYHSFSGHIKCVTRGWLGMRRGTLSTRLTENTAVFFLSGLMHSLVRWQSDPRGDIWAITVWYICQMIPIISETILTDIYRRLRGHMAMGMGFKDDVKWLSRAEYAFGYLWVSTWFMTSIPGYYKLRERWTDPIVVEREIDHETFSEAVNETE